MRHHPAACCLVATLAVRRSWPRGLAAGRAPGGRRGYASAASSSSGTEASRVEGRLVFDPASGSGSSRPTTRQKRPLPLEPGTVVQLPGRASRWPPRCRRSSRCWSARRPGSRGSSGRCRDRAVTLSVPWQAAEVSVARPGVQAVLQRPGEARLFAEEFDRIDAARWSVTGKPELARRIRRRSRDAG